MLSFVCSYMLTFLLPFYLIQERRIGAAGAGLLLAGNAVARTIVAPLGGALSDRAGARMPQTLGMGMLAFGLVWLSRADDSSSLSTIIAAILLAGAGTGMFVSPNNTMIMDCAPQTQRGVAAGILATSRTFGMAMGVALAAAMLPAGHSGTTGFGVAGCIAIVGAALCVLARAQRFWPITAHMTRTITSRV